MCHNLSTKQEEDFKTIQQLTSKGNKITGRKTHPIGPIQVINMILMQITLNK